jgi:hypothetical protein
MAVGRDRLDTAFGYLQPINALRLVVLMSKDKMGPKPSTLSVSNVDREVKVFVRGEHVKTIIIPAGQPPRDSVLEQLNLPKPRSAVKKVCQYLGPVLSHVPNELCGCQNKLVQVHQCLHFDQPATTTQYKISQPELCCIGCDVGPFSADF